MSTTTLVHGAQVITGTDAPPIRDGAVLVRDAAVVAVGPRSTIDVPAGTREIELGDATILPGLIDCHEHLVGRGRYAAGTEDLGEPDAVWSVVFAHHCAETVRRGITTVRVPGSHGGVDLAVRRALLEGHLVGPRLVCAGLAVTMTGGHGHGVSIEVDGPAESARAARSQLAAGADFIKVMASGGVGTVRVGEDPTHPEMTVEELTAVVDVANAARRRVAAHADGEEGIGNALAAGVHCIEHGIFLTDEQARDMARRGVMLVPTLSTMVNIARKGPELGLEPGWSAIAERILDVHRRSFQAALDAGVTFATGTDSYGDMVDEIRELTTYGLSPMRAIQAATRDAAAITDANATYGTLEPGRDADVIAVAGDPLEDLERLRDVQLVMADGTLVVPPAS
jgi:imidazolonepropionase-like amidohydrolase